MKNFGRFLLTMRDSFRRPFTTKAAVFNLVFWALYGNFIVAMMIFNKYVTGAATWFTFWANVACLLLAITNTFWAVTGIRYRLFIRKMRRTLDPAMKAVMGPEHGLVNVRYGYHDRKPGLFLGDCSCGCEASVLIDAERQTINILSKAVMDKAREKPVT